MTAFFTRANLLDRLREGPLPGEDWLEVARSRKSLHVRIHRLRKEGFVIGAIPMAGPSARPRRGRRPPVVYQLLQEPASTPAKENA